MGWQLTVLVLQGDMESNGKVWLERELDTKGMELTFRLARSLSPRTVDE